MIKKTLPLLIVFTLSLAGAAQASTLEESNEIPLDSQKIIRVREMKKVLGRGLSNRGTGDSMQLACIGNRMQENSLERKCDVLRFIFRNVAGEEYLIGPSFYLHSEAPIKYQMKEYFEYWKINKDVAKKRKFLITRILYPWLFGEKRPEASGGTRTALNAGLVVTQGLATNVALGVATTTASGVGLFLVGGLLSPFLFDLATLPFTAIIDGSNAASIWGFSGKDLASLNSKSVEAWSIRPKKTKAKRFTALFSGLMRVSVRESRCADCSGSQRIHFQKSRSVEITYARPSLSPESGEIASQLNSNPYELLKLAREEGFKLADLESEED